MHTPTEPEGGCKTPYETTIILLNSAGKPWQGSYVDHNRRRHHADKEGKVKLHINGGVVSANDHPITKLVKGKVHIVLQYDMWKGGMQEKPTSSDNTPLPHHGGSRGS